jgi:hypothetical protein
MGKVKSALEIALEKADKIGTLSLEEKEKIREEEKVASIMKDYYQEKIDSNALCKAVEGKQTSSAENGPVKPYRYYKPGKF